MADASNDPKVLLLVLASDNEPVFQRLQEIWRSYMHRFSPRISSFFFKERPEQGDLFMVEGDTLYIRMPLNGKFAPYEKTRLAFEFFTSRYDDFDFVFRTNLSSFIDFHKYLEQSVHWPRKRFCSAVVGMHGGKTFPSGSGFTMSWDVVKLMAESRYLEEFVDDVVIGRKLLEWGIPIVPALRHDACSLRQLCKPDERLDVFHYRIKNLRGDRLALDVPVHLQLCKEVYGE